MVYHVALVLVPALTSRAGNFFYRYILIGVGDPYPIIYIGELHFYPTIFIFIKTEMLIYPKTFSDMVKNMRYIVRKIGKYMPLFDRDIGNKGMLISRNVRKQVAYISSNTDDDNAVVINLIDATDVYVDDDSEAFMLLTSI